MTSREHAEILRQDAEACAASFLEFVREAWHVLEPDQAYSENWHIELMCAHLEAVAAGLCKLLLINVPPGTMKSLLVCVLWPAWVWTKRPGKRFMFSSYAETLSLRDSEKCRTLIESRWYRDRWPVRLKLSQNAKSRFDNGAGGWRIVGSVGGRGIGEHPDFNVADDPHNVLQAESDKERETVKNWFEGVFCVRGQVRDAGRVLVMQRLHGLDCAGVALAKGGWTHICLPMRYEAPRLPGTNGPDDPGAAPRMLHTPWGHDPRTIDGQLLWPAKYPEGKVLEMEGLMGAYNTAGQLQQRPSPRGGSMFQRAWFPVLPALPPCRRFVRYWDKAATAGAGAVARSSGTLMGEYEVDHPVRTMRTRWVVVDVKAGAWTAADREQVISQTAATDRATFGHVEIHVEQEPGSGGKESAESTIASNPSHAVKADKVTGDKQVRAEPLQAQASIGKIALLAGSWTQELLDEMEQFPVGRRKDIVDSTAGAFNKLAKPGGALDPGAVQTGPQRREAPVALGGGFASRLGPGDF